MDSVIQNEPQKMENSPAELQLADDQNVNFQKFLKVDLNTFFFFL